MIAMTIRTGSKAPTLPIVLGRRTRDPSMINATASFMQWILPSNSPTPQTIGLIIAVQVFNPPKTSFLRSLAWPAVHKNRLRQIL